MALVASFEAMNDDRERKKKPPLETKISLPVLDGDVVRVELALALDGDQEGRAAARCDQLPGEGLRLEAARERALKLLDGFLNQLPVRFRDGFKDGTLCGENAL